MTYVKQSAQVLAHGKPSKNISYCYELNCIPQNSNIEVPTPITTECDYLEAGSLKE